MKINTCDCSIWWWSISLGMVVAQHYAELGPYVPVAIMNVPRHPYLKVLPYTSWYIPAVVNCTMHFSSLADDTECTFMQRLNTIHMHTHRYALCLLCTAYNLHNFMTISRLTFCYSMDPQRTPYTLQLVQTPHLDKQRTQQLIKYMYVHLPDPLPFNYMSWKVWFMISSLALIA